MAEYICLKCSYIGKPRKVKRGSGKTELIGWMCFPLGLPYTFWRMFSRRSVCRQCGDGFLEPLTSAVGKRLSTITKAEIEALLPATVPANRPDEKPTHTHKTVKW